MSKERCEAVKQLLKQTLGILQSKAAGEGRGVSLAITYIEDAYLRMDYHMRQFGWNVPAVAQPVRVAPTPQQPVRSQLAPAAQIPQLRTGIMDAPATKQPAQNGRDPGEVEEDLSFLE